MCVTGTLHRTYISYVSHLEHRSRIQRLGEQTAPREHRAKFGYSESLNLHRPQRVSLSRSTHSNNNACSASNMRRGTVFGQKQENAPAQPFPQDKDGHIRGSTHGFAVNVYTIPGHRCRHPHRRSALPPGARAALTVSPHCRSRAVTPFRCSRCRRRRRRRSTLPVVRSSCCCSPCSRCSSSAPPAPPLLLKSLATVLRTT